MYVPPAARHPPRFASLTAPFAGAFAGHLAIARIGRAALSETLDASASATLPPVPSDLDAAAVRRCRRRRVCCKP
jgi:hypothetical protein